MAARLALAAWRCLFWLAAALAAALAIGSCRALPHLRAVQPSARDGADPVPSALVERLEVLVVLWQRLHAATAVELDEALRCADRRRGRARAPAHALVAVPVVAAALYVVLPSKLGTSSALPDSAGSRTSSRTVTSRPAAPALLMRPCHRSPRSPLSDRGAPAARADCAMTWAVAKSSATCRSCRTPLRHGACTACCGHR
jgi:hypothetical protein